MYICVYEELHLCEQKAAISLENMVNTSKHTMLTLPCKPYTTITTIMALS